MDYDAELRLHNEVLRLACGIRRHDRVLDIGCGAGQTTRDAARIAAAGSAVGVDISAGMIARAQVLADAEGLRNVRFEQADAQVHRFPSEHFDVAISRFGTMFFADPIAAFSNIRSRRHLSNSQANLLRRNSANHAPATTFFEGASVCKRRGLFASGPYSN